MRLSDIINLGKQYLLYGIILSVIICSLVFFVYFIVYKKLSKGTKVLSRLKLFLLGVFICYITVVLGAVFLVRADWGGGVRWLNLPLFSQYREAWHNWSFLEWRNIIFNILMFVPMGILLPLLSDKFKSLWKTVCTGFAFTVFIESVQYFARLGIADTDDIIGNTLGTLIGYGLVMCVLTIMDKAQRKPLKIIGYVSPLLITILAFSTIFAAYHFKEFGNLFDNYYHRVNMSGVDISYTVELSEEKARFDIYKTEPFNKKSAREFAEQFFDNLGTAFDNQREPQLYDESAFYYSTDQHHLYIDYINNFYKLTDFKGFSEVEKDSTATENIIREILAVDYKIILPDNIKFINLENGDYTLISDSNANLIGTLNCSYYADGTIKNITNTLFESVFIRECEVISQKDAFNKMERGNFQYSNNFYGELRSLEIISVVLDNKLDTKGFYQPVYIFEVIINGINTTNILIPALIK